MILGEHEERRRLNALGYDLVLSPSETDSAIAKQRVRDAVASCEVFKARANIKAKEIVKNARMK